MGLQQSYPTREQSHDKETGLEIGNGTRDWPDSAQRCPEWPGKLFTRPSQYVEQLPVESTHTSQRIVPTNMRYWG
jgi:hypothetical protein